MALSIPLPVLLGLVASGIVGTTAILFGIGWGVPASIEGPETARERYLLDHPDDDVVDVVVDTAKRCALLLLADQSIGLVTVVGDRFSVRKLRPGSLTGLQIAADRVELSFRDVAFPRATLRLPEGSERAPWTHRLSSCTAALPSA